MRDSRYATQSRVSPWGGAGMSQEVFDTRVLPLFGLGLVLTAASAYLGLGLPRGISLLALIAEFILVLTSGMWAENENRGLNVILYGLVTVCAGIGMVPLLQWANFAGGIPLIAQAFAVTGITFGGLMAYSLTTKRNFEGLGGFLTAMGIGLIFSFLISMFFGNTLTFTLLSMVSVVFFAGFVLYDMSVIRNRFSDQMYVMAAIMLFIDFLGLFKNILYLMGIMGSDD